MKNDLISVIIPIYKVEKYLKKCVNSVINQTYSNLEIILVDDGSPDNCGMICDEYADNDKRIRVIHKLNGGLSDARNAGIEIAKGKYITFIDSDDYVDVDYVEYLYNLIKKYKTNISFCNINLVYNEKTKRNNKDNKGTYKWSKVKTFEDILYAKNFDVSAWGKMYLREQFNDVRYPKGKIFEDNDTTYKLIDKNEYIAVGFEKKYNYIIRSDSITKKEFSNNQLYLIEASDNMCNYLSKYNELTKAIERKKFWARISTLNRMITSSNRDYISEKKLRKNILEYKNIIFDHNCSNRDRISIILLILGIKIYRRCWIIYLNNRKG